MTKNLKNLTLMALAQELGVELYKAMEIAKWAREREVNMETASSTIRYEMDKKAYIPSCFEDGQFPSIYYDKDEYDIYTKEDGEKIVDH